MPTSRSRLVTQAAGLDPWIDDTGATGTLPVDLGYLSNYPIPGPGVPKIAWGDGSATNVYQGDNSSLPLAYTIPSPPVSLFFNSAAIGPTGHLYSTIIPTTVFYGWDGSTWTRYPTSGNYSVPFNRSMDAAWSGHILGSESTGHQVFEVNLSTKVQTVLWSAITSAGGPQYTGSGIRRGWQPTYLGGGQIMVSAAKLTNSTSENTKDGIYVIDTSGTTISGPHTLGISWRTAVSGSFAYPYPDYIHRDQSGGYWLTYATSSTARSAVKFDPATWTVTAGPYSLTGTGAFYPGPLLAPDPTNPVGGYRWGLGYGPRKPGY